MPRWPKARPEGERLRVHSIHLSRWLYDAVLDTVRRGVAPSVSEYVRQAVVDMLRYGEYCEPPPMERQESGKSPLVVFNLTQWARKQLEELVRYGVYKTLSDAVRAAVWRALRGGCGERRAAPPTPRVEEGDDAVELLAGRAPAPPPQADPPPPPQRPQLPPLEGTLILTEQEAMWGDDMWSRVAPCVKTLYVFNCRQSGAKCANTLEKYYLVDIECTRRRGVEI